MRDIRVVVMAVRARLPCVMVPVLSSATAVNRTRLFQRFTVGDQAAELGCATGATITADGVARPKALKTATNGRFRSTAWGKR